MPRSDLPARLGLMACMCRRTCPCKAACGPCLRDGKAMAAVVREVLGEKAHELEDRPRLLWTASEAAELVRRAVG